MLSIRVRKKMTDEKKSLLSNENWFTKNNLHLHAVDCKALEKEQYQ